MANRRSTNSENYRDGLERSLARLIEDVRTLADGTEQRRDALIERAAARGVERAAAEQAYDVAQEEGLAPALALALVIEGIGVRSLRAASADVETSEAAEPEWIDEPPAPDQARRERRLRETFRRLRSHVDREPDARGALEAFAREPDLEVFDY
jgi:hypothetical protein